MKVDTDEPAGPAAVARLQGLRVLFVTNRWPDRERPWHGIAMRKQAESLQALGIGIDVIPIRGYAARRAYADAATRVVALNRRPYDVVHAHYGHSGVVSRLHVRAPLVISYLGTDLLGAAPASGVTGRARLEARVFSQFSRLAAATITQSEQMERLLPRARRQRNTVIAEGIDTALFAPSDRDRARQELGWPADERVVLFVSDPSRAVKNYPLAQAACQRLAETVPRVALRVAADVAPEDMPRWMSAADALIMSSRYEGGPSVVKEAMACELPVVATPVGIVAEVLRDLPGLWVRPPEPEALAHGLAAALDAGRTPEARLAIEFMSLERVALRIARVYDSVTQRRASPVRARTFAGGGPAVLRSRRDAVHEHER